ncbi:MAG: hypothetical protein CENE_00938 [Candidatus Celerinatantimonas neptuna]|nr:MAG: hypothetical protein CENE_00938 [Candidatus Celerinatantimonas neptuna]
MLKKLCIVAILLCGYHQVVSANTLGFSQVQVFDEVFYRPLDAVIWYPASGANRGLRYLGNTPVFVGIKGVINAPVLLGKHPVVLLSHDYRENWQSLSWLAKQFVQQGYLVVAVNHPGTSVFDHRSDVASQWWERPEDLSRVLTWLEDMSKYSRYVDTESVVAIGHGLGGWTALQLVGAKFSSAQFEKSCQSNPNQKACSFRRELGLGIDAPDSLRDSRIKAVISLDLFSARGFTPESLKSIRVPVLMMKAGIYRNMTKQNEKYDYMINYVPSQYLHYQVIRQAQYFSFLEQCNVVTDQVLKKYFYYGKIACRELGSVNRVDIHQLIYKKIKYFLKQELY